MVASTNDAGGQVAYVRKAGHFRVVSVAAIMAWDRTPNEKEQLV